MTLHPFLVDMVVEVLTGRDCVVQPVFVQTFQMFLRTESERKQTHGGKHHRHSEFHNAKFKVRYYI